MSSAIQLFVGLANPGKEYAATRHNAGAWFIEALANQSGTALRPEKKFHGLYGSALLVNKPCHLLIPTTFMNNSGRAVNACLGYHKLPPDTLLVAHDDIDLPVGTVRLKFDGGDGGHNGLKDIIQHLNTKQFYRLRIGVGHPGQRDDVVDYVLNPPAKAEQKKIVAALQEVESILPLLLAGEFQQAMHKLHTSPL